MREGDWKLVRLGPALPLRPETLEDQQLADEYVLMDIAYKYELERAPTIFDWPELARVINELPRHMLYNIANDPLEMCDLWDEHPRRAAKVLKDLET